MENEMNADKDGVATPVETKLDNFLKMVRVWVERDGGNMEEALAWMYADGVKVDAPSATQAALRYRVKGAPDGKWHYVDHPELMRRVIATREEGEGGGYLYEVEPLAVIPSGVPGTDGGQR